MSAKPIPECASASAIPATQPPAQPADLFDFWLGDWQLSWPNADGSKGTGRNRITKILGGEGIQEDFEALTGSPPPRLNGSARPLPPGGTWAPPWAATALRPLFAVFHRSPQLPGSAADLEQSPSRDSFALLLRGTPRAARPARSSVGT